MTETQGADAAVTFDWTAFDSPSIAVVTAIAEAEDVTPLDVRPLYESTDPEALDTMVESTSYPRGPPDTRIEFSHQDYRVLLEANGRGHLYDQDGTQAAVKPQRPEVTNQMN